jgi:hypothetical protein
MSDPCATVAPMQSEQTRQSKRERRRLEREQRRRSLRASLPGDASAASKRGVFAALLDYAGPLLDALPEDASLEQTSNVLLLAMLVWNVVVEQDGDAEAARKLIADMKAKVLFPPPDALVKWLAHRKISRFGDDPRLIRSADIDREFDS